MRASHILILLLLPTPCFATKYQFCLSSDRRPGNMLIDSGPLDFGKEWYRVKAAQAFCQVTGASGCSSTDFNRRVCGSLPIETLNYYSASGDQIKALFSGNPVVMAQSTVEIVTGVPVRVVTESAKEIAKAANKACRLLAPHC